MANAFFNKPKANWPTWAHQGTNISHMADLMLAGHKSNPLVCDIHTSRFLETNSDHHMVTSIIKLNISSNTRHCKPKPIVK